MGHHRARRYRGRGLRVRVVVECTHVALADDREHTSLAVSATQGDDLSESSIASDVPGVAISCAARVMPSYSGMWAIMRYSNALSWMIYQPKVDHAVRELCITTSQTL